MAARLVKSALLLLLAFASRTFAAAAPSEYEIVSLLEENEAGVVVARRRGTRYLLYNDAIIGAEIDHPATRMQAAYPGFAIMQAAAYMDRPLTRAAQIGLGIGTVPSFLRAQGIPTDVVEISDAVVRQASNYFYYERCEADDPEECVNGETFVTDGLAFLQAPRPRAAGDGYDLFIIDVYTGWNPVAFYVQEVMERVRDQWLRSPASGVLVVNFVGLVKGPHAVVPKSIFRTLQSVFTHVKCFREVPNTKDRDASNIVFFASNAPFTFNVPTEREFDHPMFDAYYNVMSSFQNWEIFTDMKASVSVVEVEKDQHATRDEDLLSSRPAKMDSSLASPLAASTSDQARVLTREDHGQLEFQDTHEFTQQYMRGRVEEQFPGSFWAEVEQRTRAKAAARHARSRSRSTEL